jgi:hypothetical protein
MTPALAVTDGAGRSSTEIVEFTPDDHSPELVQEFTIAIESVT